MFRCGVCNCFEKETCRKRCGEFNDSVIQKRRTYLHGMGHGDTVHLREDIVGKRISLIEPQVGGKVIACTAQCALEVDNLEPGGPGVGRLRFKNAVLIGPVMNQGLHPRWKGGALKIRSLRQRRTLPKAGSADSANFSNSLAAGIARYRHGLCIPPLH